MYPTAYPTAYPTVLICLGLDARDQHLINCCVAFAGTFQIRRVLLAHVYPHEPLPAELMGQLSLEGDAAVSTVDLWVREISSRLPGVEVVGIHAIGQPHEEVLRIEEREAVDLVMLGRAATPLDAQARGHRGRSILRYTSNPVLVVPHGAALRTRRALVGFDFSQASTHALKTAVSLFPRVSSAYVYQIDNGLSYGGLNSEELVTRLRTSAQAHFTEQVLAELPAGASAPGLQVVEGSPPSMTLIKTAREWGADLVVMGSHGQTKLAAMLLGSTAEYLVANCPLPVLVVRQRGTRLGFLGSLMRR